MANTESELKYLRQKLARLELVVLALFASEDLDSNPRLSQDLLYLFSRSVERDNLTKRDRLYDREFMFLLEQILHRSPERHRFSQRLTDVERKTDETLSLIEELRTKVNEQSSTLQAKVNTAAENIEFQLASFRVEHSGLKQDVHGFLAIQSLGLDLSDIPLPRFVPIRVYLSDADPRRIRNVSNAVRHLTETFGFTISDEFPDESGSWWKKWFVRSKEAVTQPEVVERLKKIERAVELQGLYKPQSEINKNEAEAVATILKAIESVPTAAIQAGAILLVKTSNSLNGPCIQVKTLTQRELIHLEKNQKLLTSPQDIFSKLSELNSQDQENIPALPQTTDLLPKFTRLLPESTETDTSH